MFERGPQGYAIGVDLVELAGFARKLAISPRLIHRTFTPAERAAAGEYDGRRRESFLAGRFAAKEAVLKALGVGIADVALTDVEVTAAATGEPVVALRDSAQRVAAARGVTQCRVSISHDGGFAVAFALLA
jgi:holo-[acyl-carrier protein] synthase